ncbi:MAG: hypothetical protein D3926_24455 [Desulfobacteraceae bacterium]|nr:MAG: hypothetical protein D3926_24455 [Desulfobacteraceae bacterium]
MDELINTRLVQFLKVLGLDEEPMGMFFCDQPPEGGFSPKAGDLPTLEKERDNAVNWQEVFGSFSCVIKNIWLARKKQSTAWFSASHFGCPGGAFWLGFNKPQVETIINYVSSGIPGQMEGEFYCESPDKLRQIFGQVDPVPAPKPYCVFKPLGQFEDSEVPLLVTFFSRPESLCGLHQLAAFVTNDPEVVMSPWSAACGSMGAWPMHYLEKGMEKAVIGGWDPSARKFFKTDELTFTVPYDMFVSMLEKYEGSFLKTSTWENVHTKIRKSKTAWKESEE